MFNLNGIGIRKERDPGHRLSVGKEVMSGFLVVKKYG